MSFFLSPAAEAEKRRALPEEITSIDLIKAAAVILMIVDHVGHYFYPDLLWLRAIGRIGFPVWVFLVGYAAGRDIPWRLVAGALLLIGTNYIVGMYQLPLNALVTIIAIKLLLDPVMKPVHAGLVSVWIIGVILFAGIFYTAPFVEYGTLALITAIFGYLVRHRDQLVNPNLPKYFMFFSLAAFFIMQAIWFKFSPLQLLVVLVGTLGMRLCLYRLEKKTYPQLSAALPRPVTGLIQLMGRRTLEIYVLHLILFKFAAFYLGTTPERFEWLRWTWYG